MSLNSTEKFDNKKEKTFTKYSGVHSILTKMIESQRF